MCPSKVIFGDADQCLERFAYYEAMGATHISLISNFGGMPHAEIMRSLERFVKHVMPYLKSGKSRTPGKVRQPGVETEFVREKRA